jgi:hypothetical protein
MKGWYKESYRHYLAAKGITTNKYCASKYFAGYGRPISLVKVVDGKIVGKSANVGVSDASASKYAVDLIEEGDAAIMAGDKELAAEKYAKATEIRKALDERKSKRYKENI